MRQGGADEDSEDPDPPKERRIADAGAETVGGCETGHDIVRVEAGGVAGAPGVVERDDARDVAGVDNTNKGK